MTSIDKQVLQLISIIWHSSFYLFYILTSYKLYKPKRTRMQWQLHQSQFQWWGPDLTYQMYLHHYVKKINKLWEIVISVFCSFAWNNSQILRMDLPLVRICCHMIRVHLFLKANLIYKIHDGIQILHRSFYTLIMYYCDKFYLFILILKVHLSTCFETDMK